MFCKIFVQNILARVKTEMVRKITRKYVNYSYLCIYLYIYIYFDEFAFECYNVNGEFS